MDQKLKHYYHMYADGLWQIPLEEHLVALTESDLLDRFNFIGIGITGSKPNREKVKKSLPSSFNVVAETNTGWEQVTLTPLSKDTQEPAKILYAHTKGAAHRSHSQDSWRREMTVVNVYRWAECVNLLDSHDAVGCRWRRDPWRHYSGNFWWATSSYISTLWPVSCNYRDEAEAWIGQGNFGGIHADINPSGFTTHSFGRTFVSRKTTNGKFYIDHYDINNILPGDEFVNFPSSEGNKIITQLLKQGIPCSLKGNTIIVG